MLWLHHIFNETLQTAKGFTEVTTYLSSDSLTAIFTGGLFVVGVVQAAMFFWQLGMIRTSLRDAKESADAAKAAAEAAESQAKTAKESLEKLERPYVYIYNVRGFFKDEENGEYYVTYTVASFGKMPANIQTANVGFGPSDKGQPTVPPLLLEDHELLAAPILAAGESREAIIERLPTGMAAGDEGAKVRFDDRSGKEVVTYIPELDLARRNQLFFRAIINYDGPFTSGHESSALWLFHGGSFVQRGGEIYNYMH